MLFSLIKISFKTLRCSQSSVLESINVGFIQLSQSLRRLLKDETHHTAQ